MKPEENEQEKILKKAVKEYGGEDPGKEFTFRVMDAIMAEARKTAKVWKPLLGWWFWGTMVALIGTLVGLMIFLPSGSEPSASAPVMDRIAQNQVVGKVTEQAPAVVEAFNKQTVLWLGLIALGALVLVDRMLKLRKVS
jgi:hypothetical protein